MALQLGRGVEGLAAEFALVIQSFICGEDTTEEVKPCVYDRPRVPLTASSHSHQTKYGVVYSYTTQSIPDS